MLEFLEKVRIARISRKCQNFYKMLEFLENFKIARISRKCQNFQKMLEFLENARISRKCQKMLEFLENARISRKCQNFLKMLEFLGNTKMIDIWLIFCLLVPFSFTLVQTGIECYREEEKDETLEKWAEARKAAQVF